MALRCGQAFVKFEDKKLSLDTTANILEKIVGHFLYSRGQIEKPYDQLKEENAPVSKQLEYCERSTPFKDKGNYLFATPLNVNTPCHRDTASLCLDTLTESIEKFSIKSELPDENSSSQLNNQFIAETPVTTRPPSNHRNKRRVLGKLQMVSVPITPQQTYNTKKQCNQLQNLFDFNAELKSHLLAGWKIKEIIILIGNTIVSPKEQYVIDVSSLHFERESISDDSGRYVMRVMKTLFIDPFLDGLSTTPPSTNCFIMLNVGKASVLEAPSKYFEPKLRFSLPKRGSRFTLNLSNFSGAGDTGETVYMAAPRPFKSLCSVSNALKKPSRDLLDTIE